MDVKSGSPVENETPANPNSSTSLTEVHGVGDTNATYHYEVDQTGTLLLIADDNDLGGNDGSISIRTGAGGTSNNIAYLRVLESGEVVLEIEESGNEGETRARLNVDSGDILNSNEDNEAGGVIEGRAEVDVGGDQEMLEEGQDRKRLGSETTKDSSEAEVLKAKKKAGFWYQQKTEALLKLMSKRSLQFRKGDIPKMTVWNRIAKDMNKLGYTLDKDDCSKKWSNLYRTWNLARLRSKMMQKPNCQRDWPFQKEVSNLVKILSKRYNEELEGPKRRKKRTPIRGNKGNGFELEETLISRLMEETRRQQDLLWRAEESFQLRVKELDSERDKILSEIKEFLRVKADDLKKKKEQRENDAVNASTVINEGGEEPGTEEYLIQFPQEMSAEQIVQFFKNACASADGYASVEIIGNGGTTITSETH